MDQGYIQVRMSRELHERLRDVGDDLRTVARRAGRPKDDPLLKGVLSIGDIVSELLARYWKERSRQKNYRHFRGLHPNEEIAKQRWEDDGGPPERAA